MRRQRFRSAQAGRQNRQRRLLHETIGRCGAAGELEAHHPAEAGEERPRAPIARVALQPRIAYLLRSRMTLELARDPQGTVILMPHPKNERLEAAIEQEAGMRSSEPPR